MLRLLTSSVVVVSLAAASDGLSVIKPNRTGATQSMLGVPFGGRFRATNVTAFDVIAAAYGGSLPLDARHVTGVPGWARSERFDVDARSSDAPPTEDSDDDQALAAAFAMVREMLVDRFSLQTHDIFREEPVYALVQVPGAGGRGMKGTARDCDAIAKSGPFGEAPAGVDPAMWIPCAVRGRGGEIVAAGATLEQLARRLEAATGVERHVIDRTGLRGRFDFTLRWSPTQLAPADPSGVASAADAGPSLFTALQEQLGLRLESTRAPVRVLVIDHIARPTPN